MAEWRYVSTIAWIPELQTEILDLHPDITEHPEGFKLPLDKRNDRTLQIRYSRSNRKGGYWVQIWRR